MKNSKFFLAVDGGNTINESVGLLLIRLNTIDENNIPCIQEKIYKLFDLTQS